MNTTFATTPVVLIHLSFTILELIYPFPTAVFPPTGVSPPLFIAVILYVAAATVVLAAKVTPEELREQTVLAN